MVIKYKEHIDHKRGRKPIKYALMNDKYICSCIVNAKGKEVLKCSERFTLYDKPLFYPMKYVISNYKDIAKMFNFKDDEVLKLLEDNKWIKSELEKAV